MSNSFAFTGRIGNDAELKIVGQSQVCEFSVANTTGFGDKKVTNWFRCVIWGSRGEKLNQYLTKGKMVFVIGEQTIRKYQKDGVDKYSFDVRVDQLDIINTGDKAQSADQGDTAPQSHTNTPTSDKGDDLPF